MDPDGFQTQTQSIPTDNNALNFWNYRKYRLVEFHKFWVPLPKSVTTPQASCSFSGTSLESMNICHLQTSLIPKLNQLAATTLTPFPSGHIATKFFIHLQWR